MTQVAAEGQSLFSPRTLEHIHAELLAEMNTLKEHQPALHAEASKLFKENPDAKTQVGAAEALLLKVRELSRPAPAPAPESPITDLFALDDDLQPPADVQPEEVETSDLPTQTETAQPEGEAEQDDEADQDRGEEEPAEPDPSPAQELALVETPTVSWPEDTLGQGLISQLAQTLKKGETVSFVLTRTGDQLLVTVQPNPIKDESAATVIPLQTKDTPARLDAQLGAAFNDYVLGRQIARETVAASYAEKVKAAAAISAKKSVPANKTAAKPPATLTRSQAAGRLHVELSPKTALGVLTDADGKTHPFTAGTYLDLPAGPYTLNIDAEGYQSREEKLLVKAGKDTKTAVVLLKAPEPTLFAN